jgi:hypothetical protein
MGTGLEWVFAAELLGGAGEEAVEVGEGHQQRVRQMIALAHVSRRWEEDGPGVVQAAVPIREAHHAREEGLVVVVLVAPLGFRWWLSEKQRKRRTWRGIVFQSYLIFRINPKVVLSIGPSDAEPHVCRCERRAGLPPPPAQLGFFVELLL